MNVGDGRHDWAMWTWVSSTTTPLRALCLLCCGIRSWFSEKLVDRDIIHLDVSRFSYLLQHPYSAIILATNWLAKIVSPMCMHRGLPQPQSASRVQPRVWWCQEKVCRHASQEIFTWYRLEIYFRRPVVVFLQSFIGSIALIHSSYLFMHTSGSHGRHITLAYS